MEVSFIEYFLSPDFAAPPRSSYDAEDETLLVDGKYDEVIQHCQEGSFDIL
jgi:hypothetical protein